MAIPSMQDVFENYINFLRAERNASENTVRIYTDDLMGNYARGEEKGFFQFLKRYFAGTVLFIKIVIKLITNEEYLFFNHL